MNTKPDAATVAHLLENHARNTANIVALQASVSRLDEKHDELRAAFEGHQGALLKHMENEETFAKKQADAMGELNASIVEIRKNQERDEVDRATRQAKADEKTRFHRRFVMTLVTSLIGAAALVLANIL